MSGNWNTQVAESHKSKESYNLVFPYAGFPKQDEGSKTCGTAILHFCPE